MSQSAKMFVFVFFVSLIVPCWVKAESVPEKTHTLKFAPETSYIHYEESSINVKDTGPFVGLYGSYDFRAPEVKNWPLNVVHVDGHANYGNVKYESSSGEAENIKDVMFEPRVWLGRDFFFGDANRVTFYAGIGYRFLFDKFGDVGAGAYDRTSQYLYLPVGIEFNHHVSEQWDIGFNAEYDVFLQGWQKSELSQGTGYPDINNKQFDGYGVRGSINLINKGGNYNFLISPYVRYWHIDQSNFVRASNGIITADFYEPENTSLEIGLRLGVEF